MHWHRELQAAAAKTGLPFRIETGGSGHYRIKLANGKSVTASSTPSDRNAIHQVRRDLRRAAATPKPITLVPTLAPVAIEAPAVPIIVPDAPPIAAPTVPAFLYHFTNSIMLPVIISAGQLEPLHGLLWATTNEQSDKLAHGYAADKGGDSYRHGASLRVRFTLPLDGFKPWREVVTAPSQIAELEKRAREVGQNPDQWYAKREPLSLDDAYCVHGRSYKTHRWIELGVTDLTEANVFSFSLPPDDHDQNLKGDYYGVHFDGRVFFTNVSLFVESNGNSVLTGSIEADKFLEGLQ